MLLDIFNIRQFLILYRFVLKFSKPSPLIPSNFFDVTSVTIHFAVNWQINPFNVTQWMEYCANLHDVPYYLDVVLYSLWHTLPGGLPLQRPPNDDDNARSMDEVL